MPARPAYLILSDHRRVLLAVFELTNGDGTKAISAAAAAAHCGLDITTVGSTLQVLAMQAAIGLTADGQAALTSHGYKIVEDYMANESQDDSKWIGSLTQNFNGPVGAANTGMNVNSVVKQELGVPQGSLKELLDLLQARLDEVSETDRAAVGAKVEELMEETSKPRPQTSRVREALEFILSRLPAAANAAVAVRRALDAWSLS